MSHNVGNVTGFFWELMKTVAFAFSRTIMQPSYIDPLLHFFQYICEFLSLKLAEESRPLMLWWYWNLHICWAAFIAMHCKIDTLQTEGTWWSSQRSYTQLGTDILFTSTSWYLAGDSSALMMQLLNDLYFDLILKPEKTQKDKILEFLEGLY